MSKNFVREACDELCIVAKRQGEPISRDKLECRCRHCGGGLGMWLGELIEAKKIHCRNCKKDLSHKEVKVPRIMS